MKKLISAILVIVMVLSLASIPVFAANSVLINNCLPTFAIAEGSSINDTISNLQNGLKKEENISEDIYTIDELESYNYLKKRFEVEGRNSYAIGSVNGNIIDNRILSDNIHRAFNGETITNPNGYILYPDEYESITPMTLDGYVVTKHMDGTLALYDLNLQEFVANYGKGFVLASSGADFDHGISYDIHVSADITSPGKIRKINDGSNLLALKNLESGKCGYVDMFTGKTKIPFIYEGALQFSDKLACVKLNGKWGVIDPQNNTIIDFKYNRIRGFDNGVCQVNGISTRDACLIDTSGNVILQTKSQEIYLCDNDYFIGRSRYIEVAASGAENKSRGYVDTFEIYDTTGNKITEKTFAEKQQKINVGLVSDVKYQGNGIFEFAVKGNKEYLNVSSLSPLQSKNNYIVANYNKSKVLVNKIKVDFDSYTINGNNYFKLRDVAKVVSGSDKQFEVTWDGNKNAINLISGQAYTEVGGELAKGDGKAKDATLCTSPIYQDGKKADLTAYTINGNNYFRLRDLGCAFNFGVSWDGGNNSIVIDVTQIYTED